jgi:hypothetical protein
MKERKTYKVEDRSIYNLHFAFCNLQFTILFLIIGFTSLPLYGARLTVDLDNSPDVTFVGAVERWDQDGNPRWLPDPQAKIDAPAVDAAAKKNEDNIWVFADLSPGIYDLVILGKDLMRVEGFQFAPVKEFEPFLSAAALPDEETRDSIIDDIKKSPHYENKVEPLYLAGDEKVVCVLVMLIRDKPTSYERESPGAATMRHEIWQYAWHYGAWQKEKRTKVLDRILMPRDQLRKWTWLWDPKLGGIEVKDQPIKIKYGLPAPASTPKLKGLRPY